MPAFLYAYEWERLPLLLRRMGDWVLNQIIEDIPEHIALCEFDCRRAECSRSELETCERRLNRACGELMPARKSLLPDHSASALQAPLTNPQFSSD